MSTTIPAPPAARAVAQPVASAARGVGAWARAHAMLLCISLAVVVVGMAASFADFPYFGPGQWYVAGDHWFPVMQARFVYMGATGAVYQHNTATSALPGLAILYAPAVALGDHLRLVQGFPYALARPTMWLTVGPEAFAVGSFLLWGVDVLSATLGVGRPRRRVLTVALALFAVFPTVEFAGHPEDCAALGLLCCALAAHLRGEHHKTGWWLSAAILMQTWVLLACPLLLLATPSGRRLAMAVRAALFPVAVFVLCLAATPASTWCQVVSLQPMTQTGQRTPWFAIAPRLRTLDRVAGAPSRRWGTVAAVVVGLRGIRRPSPRVLLLSASGILLLRPLFETSDWGYFSMPGLVLTVVAAATGSERAWYGLLAAAMALCAPWYGYTFFPQLNPWVFDAVVLVSIHGCALTCGALLGRRLPTLSPAPAAQVGTGRGETEQVSGTQIEAELAVGGP